MMYLIDTDILIDFFRRRPAAGEYLDSKGDWSYSVATAMELFAGANDKKQIVEMEQFLNAYSMLQFSSDIGARAQTSSKRTRKRTG